MMPCPPCSEELLDEGALAACASLLRSHVTDQLVDFDNHLDDLSADWRNGHVKQMIESFVS